MAAPGGYQQWPQAPMPPEVAQSQAQPPKPPFQNPSAQVQTQAPVNGYFPSGNMSSGAYSNGKRLFEAAYQAI